MKLSHLLDNNLIFFKDNFTYKEQVIEFMVQKLYEFNKILEPQPILDELLAREKVATSGVNDSIALPHLKTDRVSQFICTFCFIENGIDFGSLDNKKVHFAMMILAPKEKTGEYLALLARFSRIFSKKENQKIIASIKESNALIEFIKKLEENI